MPNSSNARFCVVDEVVLAAVNKRSDGEIIEAQRRVDDRMVGALEQMVQAARAGQIGTEAALALEAVAW